MNGTMKNLLYADWNRLELTTAPIPQLKHDEVLLKIHACGICGSELETYNNRSPRRTPPLIMGHEFCGEVVQVGEEVANSKIGEKKIVIPIVPCYNCSTCKRKDYHLCKKRQLFGMNRMGAFAEYVNVPEKCLIDWPEEISAPEACLAEPLANGVHVVNLTKHIDPKRVLIIGAGPIGLMCQLAFQSMSKARVIVSDLNPYRTAVATKLGAEIGINAASENTVEIAKIFSDQEGVDVVVDAVGSSFTKKLSLQALRAGGAAVWIGLHGNEIIMDSYDITLPEKQVIGTYSAGFKDYETTVQLMRDKKVDVFSWVDCYNLTEGVDVFYKMLAAQGTDIKAVLIN